MICKKEILNYIDGDESAFDTDVFPKLFKANHVNNYKNDGNWKLVEKVNDVKELNKIWESGEVFWRR